MCFGNIPEQLLSYKCFQELKGKIMLKGKKTGELEDCSDADNLESSDVSDDDKAVDKDNQATESRVGKYTGRVKMFCILIISLQPDTYRHWLHVQVV